MNFLPLNSGSSHGGEEIRAFQTNIKSEKYNYLIAGVHGDEPEGIYVLSELFEWLLDNDDLEVIPLIVIPVLNPDGHRLQTRLNAQGVDLNRNFPSSNWKEASTEKKYHPGSAPLSEIENQFLDGLFKKFPPDHIISFHSWKPMLNFNGNNAEILANFKYKKWELL